ncbi:hypothetical protein [Erythrobacter aureus]|uniref:Uncharacterized protein n=1 Tax=Erythrobacter aureus TaxID=2182384 RepID=A0A345YIH5_9SPHN|nr:hypothetical protein [Erythrobacter aureus]AXK43727.1 hypothetical protein DVR09_14815 [Erythrobacter aureus]
MRFPNLSYLGILAAQTSAGRQAIGVAITGAVELYHLVDANLDYSSEIVRDWLWTAGINPDEAATSLPTSTLIRDIIAPAVGRQPLVIHHGDLEIPFVDQLVSELSAAGNQPIISGVDIAGPIARAVNGAAGRRAFALQARYEAALDEAAKSPAIHHISGKVDAEGGVSHISITGPFAQRNWTLRDPSDAMLVMANILHIGDLANFVIDPGPAQSKLKLIANQVGLSDKLAA